MFFIISKLIDFLLSPLMWIIILLISGLFLKNIKKAKKVYITAFIFSIFFTNSAIVDELIRLWEVPVITEYNDNVYQAGIVLGGGMVTLDKENDRLIFRENTDRILQALELYQTGKIKKIIFSGGSGSLVFKDMLEAVLLKRYFTGIGIPDSNIMMDSTSNNTYYNAVNCAKIIKMHCGKGKYLLITSALHMKRAEACFENQGVCVTAYPTNKMVNKRRTDIGYYLIPDTAAIIRWEKFIHEVLGYFIYTLMGYI